MATFTPAVADLPGNGQSLLTVVHSVLALAQEKIRFAQVPQAVAFTPAVADLPGNGQTLLTVLDGLLILTQVTVRKA